MKIVVVGGSGLIGKGLVNRLRESGHEVVAASPSLGINALTREGLDAALTGAQAVVDVTNSPSFEAQAVLNFFETTTRNLLEAEAAAGVQHHLALSIVGTDRLPDNYYFRAKLAQENLIRASGVPYTIVRATQFFEFAEGIAYTSTDGETVRLSPAAVQPIAAADVSSALADYALAAPHHATVDLAGPERFGLDEFVRQYLEAQGDARQVVADGSARYFGALLNDASLVPDGGGAQIAPTRYRDWLDRLTSKV
ncbi:SDR family oxidoreductase [Paenibacillus macerans]|uniref:SDR family oxidoreductase n=1 Tax=Paenibacillus macerans TaxID=44252 RepID=UPI003D315AC7